MYFGKKRARPGYSERTGKQHNLSWGGGGGTLLSFTFLHHRFSRAVVVNRCFSSSPALFAIVLITSSVLFTPIALVLNHHLPEFFEYLILRRKWGVSKT